jgi:hypothetical protein
MSTSGLPNEIFRKARHVGRELLRAFGPASGTATESRSVVDPSSQPSENEIDWVPDWSELITSNQNLWKQCRKSGRPGPKVLIANAIGGHPVIDAIESTVAVALALRGADVHILICDGLPACLHATHDQFPDTEEFVRFGASKRLCQSCMALGSSVFGSTGLPSHNFGQFITDVDRGNARDIAASVPDERLGDFVYEDLKLGEHARAGTMRYFASGVLEGEPHGVAVLRRYLEAALLSAWATQRILKREQFDCVVTSHGCYVPHGAIAEVTRQQKKHLVAWYLAYKDRCTTWSHDDMYIYKMLDEPTSVWENMNWTEEMELELMDYLADRAQGTKDWLMCFHEKSQKNVEAIATELSIDFSKPTIGLLTNVMWDAQLFYSVSAFPNMLEWLLKTIDYFAKRPDLQLVIRAHPGEVRLTMPSKQRAYDEIYKAFPKLPKNIFVVPPESIINSYVLMNQCDTVLIYGTTMGMELACFGIPVVVSGNSWIRNKGFTYDVSSQSSYFELLDRLPFPTRRLDERTTQRAKMYNYHYHCRCAIPFGIAERREGWPSIRIKVDSLEQLLPGVDLGLDTVCDGILEHKDFIYPAERKIAIV